MTKVSIFLILVCLTSCQQPVTSPLKYSLTGTGSKTLVFIHGWCINQTYWDKQVEYFKGDYKVLTVDLAGHGKSKLNRKDWTIENYAHDVVGLIGELKLDSIILVAHSMSGDIALHMYSMIPGKVVGFIGVDNLQQLGGEYSQTEIDQINAYFDQMKNDFRKQSKEYALSNLFSVSTPQAVKDRVVHDFSQADSVMAVATLRALTLEGKNEKLLAPKLKIPLLLILSDTGKEPIVNKESLDKYAGAGYTIFRIKGTGHYPMVEAPDEFNEELKSALSQIH